MKLRRYLFESNLFRFVYHRLAPMFRARFASAPAPERLQRALDLTRIEFARFQSLGEKFEFTPRVMLIHPIQDLINGTWKETENAIEDILPTMPLLKTADIFLATDVEKNYFTRDAHFQPEGASLISDILAQSHQKVPPN
ncbi:MAG TPA: hypothetical protein EYQ69_08395 [Gemmatimonadetes bacterium]|nr:hypothetical protein [Gemmatimonadota bacterium]